ncbi:MAG: hypothetical protein JRE13_14400 [Deltaproteobacteria bacterium]|nr:hypothetical protein [Deltaproteobacteria bacterium]
MNRPEHSFAIAAVLSLALAAEAAAGAATGEVAPGAYCPFPEPGQAAACMAPAQQEYADFFSAVDAGEISDDDAAHLESEIASGATGKAPYLAISSLSYGYYRLAQRAAESPGEDPVVVARLQRWNELLSAAYDIGADDPNYRKAVRDAAHDLQQRAPAVVLACADERGHITECNSTEAVIRGINRTQEAVGIRGALERLLDRITGGDDS